MTITRARRRRIMVVNAVTVTVSLVLWWRSGGWWPLVGAGAGLVSLLMAANRVPNDGRPRQ